MHTKFNTDPVFREGLSWFFWDETYSQQNGPFKSELQARLKLVQYCQEVLGSSHEDKQDVQECQAI